MVERYYGFTTNQLIAFVFLLVVIGTVVVFTVPFNQQGQTLHEILFTAPDIIIPQAKTPVACIAIFAPVCASDRNTYDNQCVAESRNVQVIHAGECTTFEKIYGFR